MMSLKDYVRFAAVIRAEIDSMQGDTQINAAKRVMLNDLTNSFCDIFEADNDHFDRHKFKVACRLIQTNPIKKGEDNDR